MGVGREMRAIMWGRKNGGLCGWAAGPGRLFFLFSFLLLGSDFIK